MSIYFLARISPRKRKQRSLKVIRITLAQDFGKNSTNAIYSLHLHILPSLQIPKSAFQKQTQPCVPSVTTSVERILEGRKLIDYDYVLSHPITSTSTRSMSENCTSIQILLIIVRMDRRNRNLKIKICPTAGWNFLEAEM